MRFLPAPDDTLMSTVIGMVREVRDDVRRMDVKLDDIAKERREEAEKTGKFSARLSAVEYNQKSTRNVAGTALAGVIITGILAFIKLLAKHPGALGN